MIENEINKKKVSDLIAEYLKERQIERIFGIIGSANAHLFDSINALGFTKIIHVHHEQAAVMAAQTYYRVSGKPTIALATAGGSSTNAVTGVVSAWADSIPCVIISGQENTRFIEQYKGMRMWGIQGYDSPKMVRDVTKYSTTVTNAEEVLGKLKQCFEICESSRMGPTWIDIPQDVQGTLINIDKQHNLDKPVPTNETKKQNFPEEKIRQLIKSAKRPVFILGLGVRLSRANCILGDFLNKFEIPVILSWAAKDLLPHIHKLNFGSAGLYGNRCSNFIVQNSDLIIAIGTRLSIPMIGYEKSEFAREAKIIAVDIDRLELRKNSEIIDLPIQEDAKNFMMQMLDSGLKYKNGAWINRCEQYVQEFPYLEPAFYETEGYLNSYLFMDKLSSFLRSDDVIVTDMGTGLLSGHQNYKITDQQRFMTSTGLGEMGYGLPGAIGAAFAHKDKRVICLNCDGGIMMNLQELQTVVHYDLDMKLFIFNNDGYLMIKHTQKNIFQGRYSSVNAETDVTFPDFNRISECFGFNYQKIDSENSYEEMHNLLEKEGATIFEVMMDPEQFFYPKLGVARSEDGTLVSPPLEDLSPLISLERMKKNSIINLHNKSKNLRR